MYPNKDPMSLFVRRADAMPLSSSLTSPHLTALLLIVRGWISKSIKLGLVKEHLVFVRCVGKHCGNRFCCWFFCGSALAESKSQPQMCLWSLQELFFPFHQRENRKEDHFCFGKEDPGSVSRKRGEEPRYVGRELGLDGWKDQVTCQGCSSAFWSLLMVPAYQVPIELVPVPEQ